MIFCESSEWPEQTDVTRTEAIKKNKGEWQEQEWVFFLLIYNKDLVDLWTHKNIIILEHSQSVKHHALSSSRLANTILSFVYAQEAKYHHRS